MVTNRSFPFYLLTQHIVVILLLTADRANRVVNHASDLIQAKSRSNTVPYSGSVSVLAKNTIDRWRRRHHHNQQLIGSASLSIHCKRPVSMRPRC